MSRVFREVGDAPRFPAGCAVAIGAFDGVHRGHQVLLGRARALARERDLSAVALSFEPLPREYFGRGEPPARLTPVRMKIELLRQTGVDAIGLLRFNDALAAMSAESFVGRVLVRGLAARMVCVGPDFRFGRGRVGDVALLKALGETFEFEVEVAPELRDEDGQRIGATRIREALAAGAFLTAESGLGRPYAIAGRVVRGNRLGRQLGFPTANIPVRWRPAVHGIFAVRVHGGDDLRAWPAVASLGSRPTVGGGPNVLEAHLFDFDRDLYGRRLHVEFVAKLREELRFDSLEAMVAQMHEDARLARAALAVAPANAA